MARLWRQRRRDVKENLRRVLGTASERVLDEAADEAFSSYARYWVESARLVDMNPRFLLSHTVIENYDALLAAQAAGRGAIIALPHLGSWEVGGRWLSLKGNPMTTVVEPARPPELFEWMRRQRSAFGLEIVPLGRDALGILTRRLRQGRVVGLVADRDIAGNGVEVDLFGEKTRLPGGPAVLALRTGAALFPAAVYQRPWGYYRGVIRPEIEAVRAGGFREDVVAITQRLAHEFEDLIRAAPTQWHVFQPNWPTTEGA
jgi:KDO2-lipid IV(A) lauroyltransferase